MRGPRRASEQASALEPPLATGTHHPKNAFWRMSSKACSLHAAEARQATAEADPTYSGIGDEVSELEPTRRLRPSPTYCWRQ